MKKETSNIATFILHEDIFHAFYIFSLDILWGAGENEYMREIMAGNGYGDNNKASGNICMDNNNISGNICTDNTLGHTWVLDTRYSRKGMNHIEA